MEEKSFFLVIFLSSHYEREHESLCYHGRFLLHYTIDNYL